MRRGERGDEAEHVALSGAVLGFRKPGDERSHHAREAAPPVELLPSGLPCGVQGEQLVLPVAAAGDQRHDVVLVACDAACRRRAKGHTITPRQHGNGARGVKRFCQTRADRPREARAELPEGADVRERLVSSGRGALTTM